MSKECKRMKAQKWPRRCRIGWLRINFRKRLWQWPNWNNWRSKLKKKRSKWSRSLKRPVKQLYSFQQKIKYLHHRAKKVVRMQKKNRFSKARPLSINLRTQWPHWHKSRLSRKWSSNKEKWSSKHQQWRANSAKACSGRSRSRWKRTRSSKKCMRSNNKSRSRIKSWWSC